MMRLGDFKYCSKCTSHKYQDEFAANVRAKGGKQPWCRACMKAHCAAKKGPYASRGCIEYLGRQMSMNQFADLVGISRYTVQDRWQRGDRSIEALSRKPLQRKVRLRSALPTETSCLNSLLAGWKCPVILGASEVRTECGPSAR